MKNQYRLEIKNTLAILPEKLKELCNKYEVEKGKKRDFPSDFSNEKTLFIQVKRLILNILVMI